MGMEKQVPLKAWRWKNGHDLVTSKPRITDLSNEVDGSPIL